MKYINMLNEGERVNGIFFCKQKTSAVTKNGKEYGSLILQDKTGAIDGKIWNPSSPGIRDDFDAMDYVSVTGDVTVFNGSLQLNITSAQKAEEGSYSESDYLPASEYDIEEMYTELMNLVGKVKNTYLSELIKKFFINDANFIKSFKRHSAAKKVHHGFIGGLLEHTLGVVKLCNFVADRYSYLNKDLLLTAALFHDVGKVYELSAFPENDYTDDGQLLGHIVMGCEIIGNAVREIPGFPAILERQLKHCIVAHHGEFEYGSPKKPALAEALALHYADDMDAKLETFKEAISTPGAQNGEWTGFNKMLDSNIRKTII
jgi:3'-5' exoribonuclease